MTEVPKTPKIQGNNPVNNNQSTSANTNLEKAKIEYNCVFDKYKEEIKPKEDKLMYEVNKPMESVPVHSDRVKKFLLQFFPDLDYDYMVLPKKEKERIKEETQKAYGELEKYRAQPEYKETMQELKEKREQLDKAKAAEEAKAAAKAFSERNNVSITE